MAALKKLIGKGAFSKAYLLPSGDVELVSVDPVKECMALWGLGDSYLWPQIECVDYRDDGTQVYKMPHYPKVKSIKTALEPRQYELYKALRNLEGTFCANPNLLSDELRKQFETLPDEFSAEKEALLEAVDALGNYGTDLKFEISPRNVSVINGKLVLLDVFFFVSQLNQVRSSKRPAFGR
jgi:hypothetical protein